MNIIFLPIEPLEERYSASWYRNIPKYLAEYANVITIDGTALTDHVEVGAFLDVNSTVHYKAAQLQTVSKLFHERAIKNGDVFFIADLEFWGVETIRLMARLNNVSIKICGFLHAASYTKEDAFSIVEDYQKYTEVGWLALCDAVFVGSEYHKQAIIQRRLIPYASVTDHDRLCNKIQVTGNPIFAEDYVLDTTQKKRQVIISNRFDWEKRPNISLDFAYLLKKRHPDIRIVVTTSRPKFKSNKNWLIEYARGLEADGVIEIREGLSKVEYHRELAQSTVMLTNSIEENFGYCIVEALLYNTYPLMQNAYSHSELVNKDSRFLFDDEDEILDKIESLLESEMDVSHYGTRYYQSMGKIARLLVDQ